MNTARVRHAPQGLVSSLGMEDKNKKCQGSLGHSSTGNVKGGSSARPEWVRVGFLEEVDYGLSNQFYVLPTTLDHKGAGQGVRPRVLWMALFRHPSLGNFQGFLQS